MSEAFSLWAASGISIGAEVLPGRNGTSDADLLRYVRAALDPLLHALCTCVMGRVTDPDAVVDPKARVIGVQRLQIVDASIFPLLPPGHQQSLIYALAEKIADDIISDPGSYTKTGLEVRGKSSNLSKKTLLSPRSFSAPAIELVLLFVLFLAFI